MSFSLFHGPCCRVFFEYILRHRKLSRRNQSVKTPRHYDTHGDKKFLLVYPFARLLKLQAVLEPKSSSCVGRGKPDCQPQKGWGHSRSHAAGCKDFPDSAPDVKTHGSLGMGLQLSLTKFDWEWKTCVSLWLQHGFAWYRNMLQWHVVTTICEIIFDFNLARHVTPDPWGKQNGWRGTPKV